MKTFLIIVLFLFVNSTTPQSVRGVWLTNVDSDVLTSREKIEEAVNFLSDLGFNTIAVVTWNKALTLYRSEVMKKMFGIEIDPLYGNRDPLQELIEIAHSKNMKVIAWFEFGFSSSYNADGGPILQAFPHWKSQDNTGKLVKKNGFEWMNGFHPEVQDFMLSLIAEVVQNYEVDGIQGDDRLPAMPVEAGYDEYTKELFKKQHNGMEPPTDFRDSAWVQWRADRMTDFMERIYTTVKGIKKDMLISMAPSIFPWARDEYLQDWPTWIAKGYVEQIVPQLYRYKFDDYKKLLDEIISSQIPNEEIQKFIPGILLKVGSYYADEQMIREIIALNRKYGITSEYYFFYEGLKKYPDVFRELYNEN